MRESLALDVIELMLAKGYEVHGLIRRASTFNTRRIEHLYRDLHNGAELRLHLHYGDMSSSGDLLVRPDEIYHLAAQSHVRVSFDMPEYTADVTGVGTLRLLAAERYNDSQPVNPSTPLRAGSGQRLRDQHSPEGDLRQGPDRDDCTPVRISW